MSRRTHWWFIVKVSETDLGNLEREWDLQTGWKLENCYMSPLLSSNPELLLLHQCAPEKHDQNHGVNSVEAASSLGNNQWRIER